MVQPGSATVTLAASSARPAAPAAGPASAGSAITVTGSRVPGAPDRATLTSTALLCPGLGKLTETGCGVSAPAPMTRTVAVPPAMPASVACTVTFTTCNARPEVA